jgi:hypothetical protein
MGMIHSATRETSHFTFISVPLTPTSCHNGQMAKRVIRDRVNRHVAPKAMLIIGGYRQVGVPINHGYRYLRHVGNGWLLDNC